MIKNADGEVYRTPHAVICPSDGIVCLTYEEYMGQMMRANSGWICPECNKSAQWDDNCPETNPSEEMYDVESSR